MSPPCWMSRLVVSRSSRTSGGPGPRKPTLGRRPAAASANTRTHTYHSASSTFPLLFSLSSSSNIYLREKRMGEREKLFSHVRLACINYIQTLELLSLSSFSHHQSNFVSFFFSLCLFFLNFFLYFVSENT